MTRLQNETEAQDRIAAAEAEMGRLTPGISVLRQRIIQATTHRTVATVEMYRHGWAVVDEARTDLKPVQDEYDKAKAIATAAWKVINRGVFPEAPLLGRVKRRKLKVNAA